MKTPRFVHKWETKLWQYGLTKDGEVWGRHQPEDGAKWSEWSKLNEPSWLSLEMVRMAGGGG